MEQLLVKMNKNILVTGAAGFIGFHLCKQLIGQGENVLGIDNINDYYDIKLKEKRLDILFKTSSTNKNWKFIKDDLVNKNNLLEIFKNFKPCTVINLAAQAGVRYSLKNPTAYVNSNIVGFLNILECCKIYQVRNLLFASSSSVYGGNTKIPYSENDSVNHPVSIYAATKLSNEHMAHVYSHLYDIKTIGMRFFTVYGPWGRPDMAPMLFTHAILNKKPIRIFNHGNMSRSFTYIDDVIEIIMKLLDKPAECDEYFDTNNPNYSSSWCPYRIFNIGNDSSINLEYFIYSLEKELGIEAIKEYDLMIPGDVKNTQADNNIIKNWIGEFKTTSISEGIKRFIRWYKEYYE